MKITFVYTDYNPFGYNQNKFNLGVAILSSCLKEAGHTTDLLHITEDINKEQYLFELKRRNPSLIAFSFITNMWTQVRVLSKWASELRIPTVHGGIHPTIMPEEVIQSDGVNMLCRGEGEKALVELCNRMEAGKNFNDIKNLWIKKTDGEIIQNSMGPLIENLDSLPFLDYEIFNYSQLEDARILKRLVVMASRGCPYQCTYCCNHLLRTLYPNREKYVRFKSVDRLVDEIQMGLKLYPSLTSVKFLDDTLSLNKKWFAEFVDKYSLKINLPYTCNDRVNQITPEVVQGFKRSNCRQVELGIESGNEHLRNVVMKRGLSGKQIADGYKLLSDAGIETTAFNILGVPGETMGTMLETVKLNAKARPSSFTNAYFFPFKGTVLWDICKEKGYSTELTATSFFERPVLKLDTVTENQLLFVYKYFYFLVKYYKIKAKHQSIHDNPLLLEKILLSDNFPFLFFVRVYDLVDWARRGFIRGAKNIPLFHKGIKYIWGRLKKCL